MIQTPKLTCEPDKSRLQTLSVLSVLTPNLNCIQILELRNSMEQAVAEQEFLKAQQFKEQINVAEAEKEVLLASVESSDLETLKRFATPKNSLKKVAAAGVARSVLSARLKL